MEMPGREALISHLHGRLAAAGGPRGDALVVFRLRKLAALVQVAGEDGLRRVVAGVASRLSARTAAGGFAADLGEGQFALVMPAAEAEAQLLTERLLADVCAPLAHGKERLYVPVNAGICLLDSAAGDASMHVKRAERALEQAMSRGPGAVEVSSEARIERDVAQWQMRGLLEEAGLRHELSLHYQPIHAPDGGDVRKVEALLRWHSPVLGPVGPDRFIPILEDNGLICPVGEWVLGQACAQARAWREETGVPLRVAVNVSPIQIVSADFEACAQRVLAETGCQADWIELEITEGALVRDFARLRSRLEALARLGFTIAIDDFGAGYSSLGQLAQLPVHHLKMDRSLIAGVHEGGKHAGIVNAVVSLAGELGLSITSEGVERAEQAQWLARFPEMRCQGYLFSRPMTANRVRPYLGAPLALDRMSTV